MVINIAGRADGRCWYGEGGPEAIRRCLEVV